MNSVSAHPVGPENYDRVVEVGLTPEAVIVTYELEVNTSTVVSDLRKVLPDDFDLTTLQSPRDYYDAFVRFHAPEIARRLDARLDGQPLTLSYVPSYVPKRRDYEVRENVSLHCRFRFEAPWQPAPGKPHVFTFREGTYEEEAGMIKMALLSTAAITLDDVKVPDQVLAAKALTALKPGEEEARRKASATFTLTGAPAIEPPTAPAPSEAPAPPPESEMPRPWDAKSLEELLMHRGEALWLLLAVAVFLGGAHALTPGHGKTLVAAYLVGERGTVGHALYLGLVTTLSHTGVVLAVAVVVQIFFGGRAPPSLQAWLGLGGGIVVAGMGAWLLLARLTGRADHVHLLGGHHHHHGHDHAHDHAHGHADHYHDEHGHAHPLPGERVGWWRLTVLGVTGGIIPCHDAVALYVSLLSAGLLAFALPLLLAFSAGLAGVLVAIGIIVVKAKGAVGQRWSESRAFKALPIVSAALVMCVGLWLCYHSLPTVPGR